MTPEAYNAIIAQVSPLEVKLASMEFHLGGPASGYLTSIGKLEFPEKLESQPAHDSGHFVTVTQRSEFTIIASDQSVAAFGHATFQVRLKVGFEAPREFWDLFLARNIRLYTHPALRDLVASLAARAGLVASPLGSVAVAQTVSPSSMALQARKADE